MISWSSDLIVNFVISFFTNHDTYCIIISNDSTRFDIIMQC
ncbi:hypothetical protein KNP414_06709 [Paenibacillus mucilaginosus KNP414]|uniref:Uncharacterized protein n=1 Tax=Paenibacillus mucilaginosus (strain KNP414) TaxID=1036673 RepID=F8FCA9_PAEMK|nr:hypothetical protein KNP414_06709 [Paenibacillus mucilaginosus KNP414]